MVLKPEKKISRWKSLALLVSGAAVLVCGFYLIAKDVNLVGNAVTVGGGVLVILGVTYGSWRGR